MKKCFVVLLFIALKSFSQEYAVAFIPDSLKLNANAVLRYEELNVIIKDIDKAVVKHKYVITILNENADHFAHYQNQYDKLVSLSDISATLYDANGVKLKSAKRKEIYDVSDDGESFLTDDRVKKFTFNHKIYPYTVVFEDEQTYNGIYQLPTWQPVENAKFSVQESNLFVETPLNYSLRFKQLNIPKEPVISSEKKMKYNWSIKNYKAIEKEIFMPNWSDITPTVLLAPSKFLIEGYEGDMTTWDGLGKFHTKLNLGRTILPDNIKTKVHELVDNIKDDEEKIKVLYDYLQKNTRYISIQLGIGGWQPLPASFVAEKKYGDCKALSNFMVSILAEANVKAYYTIIKAKSYGISNGLYEDFPASHFNHIITCVPLKSDTMWLECTSQTVSAGYMGTITGNRKALMITDTGGVVISTPIFKAADNKQIRNVVASVDEKGDLHIKSNAILTGVEQDEEHSLLHFYTDEERKNKLNKMFSLPTYSVNNYNYKEIKGKIPKMLESLDITAPSYSSISGKRMFIVPNLFNKENKLEANKPRQFDIIYKTAYTEIDSIEIKIPQGFKVEMMPKNIDINNKFGKYKMSYNFANDAIKTFRYYEQNTSKFPASDYTDLVKFYDEMYKADRAKIVFVKSE